MGIGLNSGTLTGLLRDPNSVVEGRLNGIRYRARISIPDYGGRIETHYGRKLDVLAIDFQFRHFGLSIDFDEPVELAVHDDERRLDDGLRALLRRFGAIAIRNAYLPDRGQVPALDSRFRAMVPASAARVGCRSGKRALFSPAATRASKSHVWTAPCWQGIIGR
jgi:hypothetical protein